MISIIFISEQIANEQFIKFTGCFAEIEKNIIRTNAKILNVDLFKELIVATIDVHINIVIVTGIIGIQFPNEKWDM